METDYFALVRRLRSRAAHLSPGFVIEIIELMIANFENENEKLNKMSLLFMVALSYEALNQLEVASSVCEEILFISSTTLSEADEGSNYFIKNVRLLLLRTTSDPELLIEIFDSLMHDDQLVEDQLANCVLDMALSFKRLGATSEARHSLHSLLSCLPYQRFINSVPATSTLLTDEKPSTETTSASTAGTPLLDETESVDKKTQVGCSKSSQMAAC